MEQASQLNAKAGANTAIRGLQCTAPARRLSSGSILLHRRTGLLPCVIALVTLVAQSQALPPEASANHASLVLSHAEYLDRVHAIWMAQMIGQMTGVRFEHRTASALPVTPLTHLPGYAPVDDDYYYEMVAIRA